MTIIEQQKPDLSGEWQLNLQASALSPHVAAAAQGGALRVDHREPAFQCHMTIVLDGTPIEKQFELRSDAGEISGVYEGTPMATSLAWDGNVLLATWRIGGPSEAMTMSFRYELQDGGRRLQAAERIRGGGRDQDNVWVFDRVGRVPPQADPPGK